MIDSGFKRIFNIRHGIQQGSRNRYPTWHQLEKRLAIFKTAHLKIRLLT